MAEMSDALKAALTAFKRTLKYAEDPESGTKPDDVVQAAVELGRLATFELGTDWSALDLSEEEDQALKYALAEHEAELNAQDDAVDEYEEDWRNQDQLEADDELDGWPDDDDPDPLEEDDDDDWLYEEEEDG